MIADSIARQGGWFFRWRGYVLRREYSGLFAVIAALFFIETGRDFFVEHKTSADPAWLAIFAAGAVAYITLRGLKKHTSLLDVQGR